MPVRLGGSAAGLALVLMVAAGPTRAATDVPVDVCLEVAPGALSAAELGPLESAVASAIGTRGALFPAPSLSAATDGRIDIASGHEATGPGLAGPCLEPGYEWTARFGREFLQAGADRMLAEAPTTPGIDSSVDIEWYPEETRLRTTLVFAGPLDIPNGTCWVDDALSVDAGTVAASGEQGLETSLFAEGACGRFFDHLPDGGAGEQVATLLPGAVELADGARLRLVAEMVTVLDEAVVIAGRLERVERP